jgi:hypothetical protein
MGQICSELTIIFNVGITLLIKVSNSNGVILIFFSYSFVIIKCTSKFRVLHFVKYLWFKLTNTMATNFGMYSKCKDCIHESKCLIERLNQGVEIFCQKIMKFC